MSYTGNAPAEQYISTVKDTFNGDGSTTDFTLSRTALVNNLEVFVENVQQEPTTAYTVSGTTLSFTSAPVSGTGNIYVIHRGQAVQTVVPPAGISLNATDATITGAATIGDGITVDNDGATVATFDRATSDGTIVDLQKDGTTVGSIGSISGAVSYIVLDPRASGSGLRGSTASILATNNTGANNDNAIDLGSSTTRFKDLYLSGGVYLGGTGAANYLDDYEEGTWTAALTTDGTAFTTSGNTVTGHYVKVGRQVRVSANTFVTSPSSGTGNVIITGLPFTSSTTDDSGYTGATRIGRFDLPEGSGSAITAFIGSNSTVINLVYSQNNANPVSVQASHLNGNVTPFLGVNLIYNID